MAYKKYIKKHGKLYGPYIYESHRIDGKVVSEYHGVDNSKSRKLIWMLLGLLAFVILFFSVFYFGGKITGNVALDTDNLAEKNLEGKTGIIYPIVYFTLISRQVENASAQMNSGQENNNVIQINNETNATQMADETTQDNSINDANNNSAEATMSLTPTGMAVSGNEIETPINGQVSANEQFIYDLKEGESVEILSGSIRTSSNELSDDVIKLSIEEGKAVVTTTYSESEEIPKENFETEKKNNAETNASVVANSAETSGKKILNQEEKQILINEFGDVSIETTKSELFNGRYVIGYKIGNYEIEYSYDAGLDNETLNLQMENDRIKWLKDIAKKFSQSESIGEEAGQFINDYPI